MAAIPDFGSMTMASGNGDRTDMGRSVWRSKFAGESVLGVAMRTNSDSDSDESDNEGAADTGVEALQQHQHGDLPDSPGVVPAGRMAVGGDHEEEAQQHGHHHHHHHHHNHDHHNHHPQHPSLLSSHATGPPPVTASFRPGVNALPVHVGGGSLHHGKLRAGAPLGPHQGPAALNMQPLHMAPLGEAGLLDGHSEDELMQEVLKHMNLTEADIAEVVEDHAHAEAAAARGMQEAQARGQQHKASLGKGGNVKHKRSNRTAWRQHLARSRARVEKQQQQRRSCLWCCCPHDTPSQRWARTRLLRSVCPLICGIIIISVFSYVAPSAPPAPPFAFLSHTHPPFCSTMSLIFMNIQSYQVVLRHAMIAGSTGVVAELETAAVTARSVALLGVRRSTVVPGDGAGGTQRVLVDTLGAFNTTTIGALYVAGSATGSMSGAVLTQVSVMWRAPRKHEY